MRILFVTGALIGGGAERVIANLATSMSFNHEIGIVQLVDSESYPLPSEVTIFKYSKKRSLFSPFKKIHFIKESCKLFKPDIAISFMSNINVLSIVAFKHSKIKCILSERNNPYKVPSNALLRFLRNFAYRFGDGFVFQTTDAKHYFSKRVQQKSTIIKNPLNPLLPSYKSSLSENKIVMVGRLEEAKNYFMALDAFSKVLKVCPFMRLIIYGEGKLKNDLINMSIALGINKSITFMGFNNKWFEEARNSKLYWLTSNYEGMSNSLIEAMAIGIPSISTDHPIGGARELINGTNGFLVGVGDSEALANKTIELINDCDMLQSISNASYTFIRKEMDSTKISLEWINYCVSIIKND